MTVKKGNTLPIQFDEELARQAQAIRTAEAASVTGNKISIRGGMMQWRGAAIDGNKFDGIILASIFENDYYTAGFDPNTPASPVCYAFGTTLDDLRPHADSEDKQGAPQTGLCKGCWANGFGSSTNKERPKGKACQNRRRLAVIPAAGKLTAESVAAAELAFMQLPVMSTSAYSNFVMQVADTLKVPPFAVVAEIKVVPDQKSQFRVVITAKEQIKNRGVLGALFQRAQDAAKQITYPYPKNTDKPAKTKAPAKKKKF